MMLLLSSRLSSRFIKVLAGTLDTELSQEVDARHLHIAYVMPQLPRTHAARRCTDLVFVG